MRPSINWNRTPSTNRVSAEPRVVPGVCVCVGCECVCVVCVCVGGGGCSETLTAMDIHVHLVIRGMLKQTPLGPHY